VKAPFRELVPPGVAIDTLTDPAVPLEGAVTFTVVAFTTETEDAGASPNMTDVAPARFKPVRVTAVPPASGPVAGATELSIGGAT